MNQPVPEEGVCQIHAVMLLVAITVILALLLLLMLHIPLWPSFSKGPPEIFAITELKHHCETGTLNYDSRVTIMHAGTAVYRSDDLRAEIFVNDQPTHSNIMTMNSHLFIASYHIGVQRLWGIGSTGHYWYPGAPIYLDLTDGTFRPGDLVRLDVYHKEDGGIISRSEMIA